MSSCRNNENLNGYYIVRNDDFIYNPRISVTAPVGPINRNRLGRNQVNISIEFKKIDKGNMKALMIIFIVSANSYCS